MAEGRLAVERLLASSHPVESLLIEEGRATSLPGLLAATVARGAAVHVVTREVMHRTVGFDLHRGVLALGRRLPNPDLEVLLVAGGPLVVAEGLNDHENLGALFRNAAALGAGGVILDPTSADPLYRRSVRVSLGHVLSVPWTRCPDGPGRLRAAGWHVLALTPDPTARPLQELAPAARIALLVGSEGPGLSAGALAAASERVRIPMAAGVDSLNVATAVAIALWQLRPATG